MTVTESVSTLSSKRSIIRPISVVNTVAAPIPPAKSANPVSTCGSTSRAVSPCNLQHTQIRPVSQQRTFIIHHGRTHRRFFIVVQFSFEIVLSRIALSKGNQRRQPLCLAFVRVACQKRPQWFAFFNQRNSRGLFRSRSVKSSSRTSLDAHLANRQNSVQ